MRDTRFDVKDNYQFTAVGYLEDTYSIIEKKGLAESISKSVDIFNNIKDKYIEAIENDGKLINAERVNLLVWIDHFLDLMLIIWKDIDRVDNCIIKIDYENSKFKIQIKESSYIWRASGCLEPEMLEKSGGFASIFKNKLTADVIKFLKVYKDACKDQELDMSEREKLKKEVSEIIYYIIYLHFQVERCLIDR